MARVPLIQIAVVSDASEDRPSTGNYLYALDAKGRLWRHEDVYVGSKEPTWREIPTPMEPNP